MIEIENIENIELTFLSINDYQELKKAMIESYPNVRNLKDRRTDIYELRKK